MEQDEEERGMKPELSIVIVSFNTQELLKECLEHLYAILKGISFEVIVVDNASRDGSFEMVQREFPSVRSVQTPYNIGFGPANNIGFKMVFADYILLLNSDAFPAQGVIQEALKRMQLDSTIGYGGCRLTNPDGTLQPSGRLFPSLLNIFLEQSGLAEKYERSKFFGRYNRTWADPQLIAEVDWIPGAFALIPKKALDEVGGFDERFFLYFEEVDLCRRLKAAGWKVVYWGDLTAVHLGGKSSGNSRTELWRLRTTYLYAYKYGGFFKAWIMKQFELNWHRLRALKNFQNLKKKQFSSNAIKLIHQAWKETEGGRFSPPPPW